MPDPKQDGRGGPRPGSGRPRGRTPNKMRSLTIQIPPDDFREVEQRAEKEGNSLSGWIVDAIKKRLMLR